MARECTAHTTGVSIGNGHALGPVGAEATPTDVPSAKNEAKGIDDDDEVHFDFDELKRRYPDNLAAVPNDPTLLAGGIRSLPSISTQAFACGFTLAACLLLSTWLVLEKHNPVWRLPAFFACLSLFHYLEFYTTARYNPQIVRASSFLIFNNGRSYALAHTCATVEIIVSNFFLPDYQKLLVFEPFTVALGLAIVVLGQIVRSTAMAQAGTNFNHTPVQKRKDDHVLVTHGVYQWSRHPSYFGFFWWALGTQVLVGNKVCLVGYAIALWRFFSVRIKAEERTLVEFFGEDYHAFRKHVGTRIPFIP